MRISNVCNNPGKIHQYFDIEEFSRGGWLILDKVETAAFRKPVQFYQTVFILRSSGFIIPNVNPGKPDMEGFVIFK